LGASNPPPYYLSLAPEPHTLRLLVVTSQNSSKGAATLNGTSHGAMSIDVPEGWRVNVSVANEAATHGDALAVVAAPGDAQAVFGGGATTVRPSGQSYFHFTASKQGQYVLASTAAGRGTGGEWLYVNVVPSSQVPELDAPGHAAYKVVVGVVSSGAGG